MTTSQRPVRRTDVEVRRDPRGSVLVDPRTGAAHILNHTALAVWELCDGETLPTEMVAAVCDLCDMQPDVVAGDIARVLEEFEQADLVSWRGGSPQTSGNVRD